MTNFAYRKVGHDVTQHGTEFLLSENAVVLGPGTALVWMGFISVITWVSVLRGIFFFLLDLTVSAFPDITIFF